MSFLAPLLFAGALMIAAPWLLHRIRKPQHQTIVFGSMMFVPQVKKKVLEKKAIQHWLLMVLRMLLLLILVVAFSRPYQLFLAAALPDDGAARHVIVLDCSFSMGAEGRFDEAKQNALNVVSSVDANERIGLILFHQTVSDEQEILIEGESPQDNHRRIRQAIELAPLSEYSTAYRPALQRAQDMLLSGRTDDSADSKNLIHIVSDFQQAGMPPPGGDWRASSQVEFQLHAVNGEFSDNAAVSDVALRQAPQGGFVVLAQIKNWSEQETTRTAALFVDGVEVDQKDVTVQAGHSMKVSFKVDWDIEQSHSGHVQIGDDSLPIDNRHYFAWNPEMKHAVAIYHNEDDRRRWPAGWFIEQALNASGGSVWTIESQSLDDLPSISAKDDAVLAPSINLLGEGALSALESYLSQGGKAMVWIDSAQSVGPSARRFVESMGFSIEGKRYEDARGGQFDILSWIDFDHSIFYPMREMEFNDFSMVHVYQYLQLAPTQLNPSTTRVLARFDETRPLLIEHSIGDGALLMWTTAPSLDETNFARNPKFVAVLFESLNYLIDAQREKIEYAVGDELMWDEMISEQTEWTVTLPTDENSIFTRRSFEQDETRLLHSGVVRWSGENSTFHYAVNLDATESNPAVVIEDAFVRSFGSGALVLAYNIEQLTKAQGQQDERFVKVEYGWWVLVVLLIGIVIESVYASVVSRREWDKQANAEG